MIQRERRLLSDSATEPNPEWPQSADAAWKKVAALADGCNPQDWPLEQGTWILALGQKTMETVAHCYHPEADKPLYELTIPHTLLIIERASRDLRLDVAEKIPFSNRLTIGDFFRIHNSYIVNIKNVIKYNKGITKTVVMQNGKELEVSRAKVADLIRKLENSFPQLF